MLRSIISHDDADGVVNSAQMATERQPTQTRTTPSIADAAVSASTVPNSSAAMSIKDIKAPRNNQDAIDHTEMLRQECWPMSPYFIGTSSSSSFPPPYDALDYVRGTEMLKYMKDPQDIFKDQYVEIKSELDGNQGLKSRAPCASSWEQSKIKHTVKDIKMEKGSYFQEKDKQGFESSISSLYSGTKNTSQPFDECTQLQKNYVGSQDIGDASKNSGKISKTMQLPHLSEVFGYTVPQSTPKFDDSQALSKGKTTEFVKRTLGIFEMEHSINEVCKFMFRSLRST